MEGFAKISVSDRGPGISPENLSKLFDRYYQVEQTNRRAQGLGLGLFISAEIIKKHEGQFGVASEPGRGSDFWFTLPS
jgi:signal transduction histidine kinase